VHFPEKISAPAVSGEFVFVKDIAPTILELAGVEHPGTRYKGRPVEPVTGRSFVSILEGTANTDGGRVIGMELFGKRVIRSGDWKLTHMPEPYGNGDWQLFNIKDDLGEAHDLSAEYPQKFAEMKAWWDEYASKNGVILPDWVSGY
jgi:arylsulfatase